MALAADSLKKTVVRAPVMALNSIGVGQVMIVANRKIMMGKPTVAGIRITVELILEKLAGGQTIDQILKSHPSLTEAGVRAAIGFAAKS